MYIILQKSGETEPIIITYSYVFFLFEHFISWRNKRTERERSSKAEF